MFEADLEPELEPEVALAGTVELTYIKVAFPQVGTVAPLVVVHTIVLVVQLM